MNLFTLEHSKLAYRADMALYAVAVAAVATGLLQAGPWAQWPLLAACTVAGMLAWSAMEYGAHRFVLHGLPPFKRWHAIHHKRPAALVCAPTIVSAALIGGFVFLPMWGLAGWWPAVAVTLGVLIGYLFYTVTHHAIHHWHARSRWLKERKRWHALHHRRGEWPACYGVTTSFWDRLLGSVQTVPSDTGRTRCVVNHTDRDAVAVQGLLGEYGKPNLDNITDRSGIKEEKTLTFHGR